MVIGILVCCICDVAISGTLTWSLITLSSILITWIASFPVILLGKKGVLVAMVAISILILPFMYILSILIKMCWMDFRAPCPSWSGRITR